MALKQCKKCGRLLPRTQYYTHARGKDGLRARCKDCLLDAVAHRRGGKRRALSTEEYRRRYAEANRRLARARQRAYRALVERHRDEFEHLFIIEKALLEEEESA